MRTRSKIGVVAGGYAAALLIALVVIRIYIAATGGPDRITYGAMYAFGDSLLFLAVFGVASVLPTGAALYFLRPYRAFWIVLSILALVLAITGIAALAVFFSARAAGTRSIGQVWPAFAILRILVAPLVAMFLFLSGLFAPRRSFRIALLGAGGIEAAVAASYFLTMIHSIRPS